MAGALLQELALYSFISLGLLLVCLCTRQLWHEHGGNSRSTTTPVIQRQARFRLMTHNIRYAATRLEEGEQPWSTRLPLLVAHFRYHTAQSSDAIICMQEVLHHQLTDLTTRLNTSGSCESRASHHVAESTPQWQTVGVGRDDGKQAGEYAPIWYRPAAWELHQSDTVWLSPTPMKPGWGAGSNRIVTIALLEHRATRQKLVVMNTHLDDQSSLARRKAAEMLLRLVETWSQPHDSQQLLSQKTRVVLAGDLNSEADGEAYKILNRRMRDSRTECDGQDHYGENFTYTGFNHSEQRQHLDYIFVGPRSAGTIKVHSSAVLPSRFEMGNSQHVFHSDHRAVAADIELGA